MYGWKAEGWFVFPSLLIKGLHQFYILLVLADLRLFKFFCTIWKWKFHSFMCLSISIYKTTCKATSWQSRDTDSSRDAAEHPLNFWYPQSFDLYCEIFSSSLNRYRFVVVSPTACSIVARRLRFAQESRSCEIVKQIRHILRLAKRCSMSIAAALSQSYFGCSWKSLNYNVPRLHFLQWLEKLIFVKI